MHVLDIKVLTVIIVIGVMPFNLLQLLLMLKHRVSYYQYHESSDWQVSETPDYTGTLILNLIDSVKYKISANTSGLVQNKTFHVRVRYKSTNGNYSNWSNTIRFTTASSYVETPTIISPTHGAIDQGPFIFFESSPFISKDGSTHYTTDWEIGDPSSTIRHDDTILDKTTYAVTNLNPNTVYYVRVRYKSSATNNSEWSTPIYFRTIASFITPPTPIIP